MNSVQCQGAKACKCQCSEFERRLFDAGHKVSQKREVHLILSILKTLLVRENTSILICGVFSATTLRQVDLTICIKIQG